jgi:carbon storage regulator
MLVLSRKPGQKLQIGNNITLTVLEVHGRVMRLGIEAPSDVRILRGELEDWQRSEKRVAKCRPAAVALAG